MILQEKIDYVNRKVPFTKVLYKIKGLEIDSTTQIFCPYHDDINEKSARVYINNAEDYSSDGLFCFKCGNFNSFKIVYTALDENIPATLDYFKDEFDIEFDSRDISSNQHNKHISLKIKQCKAHSTKVRWDTKDMKRLQTYIRKYEDDYLTLFRETQINKKLRETPNGKKNS